MAARAADEGDQKRKFNQAHKLMKKANVDQCNFTRKLVETIDSAKSAEENAQQEIVKLDLAGEKLNWILFVEFVWGTVEEYKQKNLADISERQKMRPCSVRLARRGRPVFLQCTFNSRFSPVVSPASTSNTQFQPQPLMPSVAVFSSCWLNTGTCFACEKLSHWHSCYPAMAKQASRAPNWLDEGPQSGAVCFNFLCRNLIFEAECCNVNQEYLNVFSFFWRHAVSFGLIQGLWEPVDFSILHCTFSSGRAF